MGAVSGIGIAFEETLSGWVGEGAKDFMEGRNKGRSENTSFRLDARVTIPNFQQFLDDPDHLAHLDGTVTCTAMGGSFPIRHGVLSLFSFNPDMKIMQMTYAFKFTAQGKNYYVFGRKNIKHHSGRVDLFRDMTTLYTKIYEGEDETGPLHSAGVICFKFLKFVPLMLEMKVSGAHSFLQRMSAKKDFAAFSIRVLAQEYLKS